MLRELLGIYLRRREMSKMLAMRRVSFYLPAQTWRKQDGKILLQEPASVINQMNPCTVVAVLGKNRCVLYLPWSEGECTCRFDDRCCDVGMSPLAMTISGPRAKVSSSGLSHTMSL